MASAHPSDSANDDHPVPIVVVRLLGELAWQRPGQAPVALTAKDATLLAKLALDGPQARPVLYELIWPGTPLAQAQLSLRQRASRLKRSVGAAVIELASNVRLHPWVWIDAAHPEKLETEALLKAGVLLAGIELGTNNELDRWVERAREQVAEACAKTLADRAEALESEGRLHESLNLAKRVVELTPFAEHGCRRLMRLHYLRNDRAAAQEAYWRFHALLRDELGIRPSAETLELMQTVETASEPPRILAHRPVPASVLRPPVLIGRSRSWQAMSTAWQLPQPFLLVGEAGLGKSRLLDEFVRGTEGVALERAQPGDEHTPYALLGKVLLQIDRRFAPRLPIVLKMELARLHPDFGRAPEGAAQEFVIWNAVRQFLGRAISSGLGAIVLDDLHNADAASIDALRWLSASPEIPTLRIGLASRPHGLDGTGSALKAWLEDSHRPTRIDLEPLTPAELSELLISLALPSLLDAEIAAQLYRHAGGHPLYTLATLQDALSRNFNLRAQQLPRPGSVQALLDARLRALPAATQDLLRVSAVAGADLNADRVARMLKCSVLDLAHSWAELEAANVLRGEAFSHDLVHESALRMVPRGVRQSLHRQLAALLAAEPSIVVPGRVAWHWEQGERWGEAGRCWHAAGLAARGAGRLEEQGELFERAARCHALADDAGGRFESLHARLGGLQLRHGGSAVLAALPEVEALADTSLRRLRCRLVRAEAWLDGQHALQARDETEAAVREAASCQAFLGDANALHAEALVQCGEFEPALAAATRALASARASDDPLQTLHASDALSYVHYSTGRLAEAVTWQREAVGLAESMGYRAEAVAGEGHVAALLAAIGDVAGSHAQALQTRRRHRDLGLSDNSTIGSVNHIVLGAAAAALGFFDEALEALQAAVAMAGPQAAPAAHAKARLALANLWLTLGRFGAARSLVEVIGETVAPGMRMQAELVLARAAEGEGLPAERYWLALGRLAAEHRDLPLVQSAWFEISFQGGAAAAVAALAQVRQTCEEFGLHGTARALQWRELVRWLDIPGPAAAIAALDLARELAPHAVAGLSAKCYPPQTWVTLSQAYGRSGDSRRRDECMDSARRWLDRAISRVPTEHLAAFSQNNAINRLLLS